MIVTENLKDFPATVLSDLDMEAKSADAFIADTIALDQETGNDASGAIARDGGCGTDRDG